MKITLAVSTLLGLTAISEAVAVTRTTPFTRALQRRQNRNGGNNGNNGNNGGNAGADATVLLANAVQTGSQSDGQADAAAGQSPSATDDANFINFCAGETLTNGLQNRAGSCNGIVMGKIPSANNMVSSVFTSPQNGDTIPSNTDFDISVQMINFAPGTFTNPDNTYYTAPQDLDGNGNIIGHTHVSVQDTGNSQNPTTPLDPATFVFFKGINDAGNGQGLLSAAVTGGLPAGNYRVCTMSSSANHQPVLMPVAQRGPQDDCVRFTVADDAGNGGNAGNGNAGNGNADNGNAGNGNAADPATDDGTAGNGNADTGNGNADTGNGNADTGNGNADTGNAGNGNANDGTTDNGTTPDDTTPDDTTGDDTTGNGNTDTGNTGNGNAGNGGFNNGNANNGTTDGNTGNTGNNSGSNNGSDDGSDADTGDQTGSDAAGDAAAGDAAGDATSGGTGGASSANALGGIAAPAVTDTGDSDRPFGVSGNTFVNKSAAIQRACDIQNNACANAVNSGKLSGSSVGDCNAQVAACEAELS